MRLAGPWARPRRERPPWSATAAAIGEDDAMTTTAGDPDTGVAGTITWARAATAAASLGATMVHAAAVPVHFDHGTRFGVAFVVMADDWESTPHRLEQHTQQ